MTSSKKKILYKAHKNTLYQGRDYVSQNGAKKRKGRVTSTPDGKQVINKKQNPNPPPTSLPDEFCHLQNNKKNILPPCTIKKNNLCRSPYIYLLYKTQRDMKETFFFSVEEPMFSFSTLIYTLKLCFEVLLPFINHPKTFKMHRISINNQPGKWKCPNNFGSHNDSFVT